MPAQVISISPKRRIRMERHDYHKLCTIEVLRSQGNDVSGIDLETFKPYHRDIDMATWTEANRMRTEMFGYESLSDSRYDDLEPLFRVKLLTLQETAIAKRSDITHAEKIEMIRPLRAKREAHYFARIDRAAAEWDAAHPEEANEETVIPQTFEQRIGEHDATLARGMGIRLD